MFQLRSINGFAKITRYKSEDKVIETPTLMTLSKDEKAPSWFIGDTSSSLSMNFPPNYLTQEINTAEKFDFSFIASILMQKSLKDEIIVKQFEKVKHELSSRLATIDPEKAVILIQPTDSQKVLKMVLESIKELQIKNVAITNFLPLLNNFREAVDFLATVKTTLPIDTIVYLLSPVPHIYFPILSYLGIDVFSSSYTSYASKQSVFLTDNSAFKIEELDEQICFCEACNKLGSVKDYNEKENQEYLEKHNSWVIKKQIREIRNAIKSDNLRSYVEQHLQTQVFNAGVLRLLDKYWSSELIARTPTWLDISIKSITSYGHTRPEIKAFQKWVLERYKIKDDKKAIVIFPCSARKPYSSSKSHMKYHEIIDSIDYKKRGYIQELILTSPLGVIPRELELAFPAAHYDIPVTGDWDFEEKEIATNQLVGVLSKITLEDVNVIAHVHDEYVELCEAAEKKLKKNFIYTSKEEKTTSNKSLNQLKNELTNILKSKPDRSFNYDTERLQAIANYQFGLPIGEVMFNDSYQIKGRPPQPYMILQKKERLGVIHPSTGHMTLSMKTAKTLVENKKYYITFEGEKLEGSTLFAVGVVDADPEIRPTDAIVIVDKQNNLLGIGQAILSGKDILQLKNGPVAKIKQKVK
ncbi:MAG: hypothetical protein FK734_05245 [Asgard group archaeon]|nr:hypothetical protein [Asgard group archaeon]